MADSSTKVPPHLAGRTAIVLVNRACGHVAGLAADGSMRRRLNQLHKALAGAGHHAWRVRTEPLTEQLLERFAAPPCDACRVDPNGLPGSLRGVLAKQSGGG